MTRTAAVLTSALVLTGLWACGSTDDQTTSATQTTLAGGSGGVGGGGGSGGETGCFGGEIQCGGTCCEVGEVCFEDACSADCGGVPPCGDEALCCGGGEVCYLGECVVPGGACDGFGCATKVTTTTCDDGFTCDPDLGLCVPSLADPTCQYIPPPSQFSPRPQFTWGTRATVPCTDVSECQTAETCTGGFCTPTWPHFAPADAEANVQVSSIPVVVDLDGDCTPEIIFNSYIDGILGTQGVLRALDGATGTQKWSVTDAMYATDATSNPAVGDIDGDGFPEVVSQSASGSLVAIDHDGTPLWVSDAFAGTENSGSVAIANMDNDGLPEIIFGAAIYDASGNLLWEGTGGIGRDGQGPISCVADLDGDGRPELIGGNTAYQTTGTVAGADFTGTELWTVPGVGDGRCGVADFDDDQVPEVILVRGGNVYAINGQTGAVIDSANLPGSADRGGAPNIADFNGDGAPDIGTAGSSNYVVFEFNGVEFTELWRAATEDDSSRVTGSSVFDFDGDGRNEVIYNDEMFIRIYPGVEPDCELTPPGPLCDGVMDDTEVLFRDRNTSRTRTEYPVVADVDGDFKAELVFSTNSDISWGLDAGIEVWGDALDNWVSTRPVWNQHSYHITNVGIDGSIPETENSSFEFPAGAPYNGYRRNVQGASDFCAPDLRPFDLRADGTACPNLTLVVDVTNVGCLGVGPGVQVSFYEETLGYLGTALTTGALPAGAKETVTFESGMSTPNPMVYVVVDDDGTGTGSLNECDEDNASLPRSVCNAPN